MVKQYEENIILPSVEFRDDFQIKKPVPEKRTNKVEKALTNYTAGYEIELRDERDPLIQLHISRKAIEHLFKTLLVQNKGFNFWKF